MAVRRSLHWSWQRLLVLLSGIVTGYLLWFLFLQAR